MIRDGRILAVHRPRHDDVSLPKGELEDGESREEAALREVEEETGLRCVLDGEVGRTHYVVADGPKEVRYFRMTADGEARPQNEVDEVRWVPLADAPALLTYERDAEVIGGL